MTDVDLKDKIEELMGGRKCPKGYICVHSKLQNLCKARDFGLENYVECLEENLHECPFALPFGSGYFCKCPLRIFIAKKLRK